MAREDSWGSPGRHCCFLHSPWAGSTDVTPPAQAEGSQREREGCSGTWQASPPRELLCQAAAAGTGWMRMEDLVGSSDCHQVPTNEDAGAKSGSGL